MKGDHKIDSKLVQYLYIFIYIVLNIISGKSDVSQLNKVYKDIEKDLPKEESTTLIKKLKGISKSFIKTQGYSGILTNSIIIYDLVHRVTDLYISIKYRKKNKTNFKQKNISLIGDIIFQKIFNKIINMIIN